MTESAILLRVLERVMLNGWERAQHILEEYNAFRQVNIQYQIKEKVYYQDIFRHDFAEVFFGTSFIASCGKKIPTQKQMKWYWEELAWLAEKDIHASPSAEWIRREEIHTNWEYCTQQRDPECPCWKLLSWKYHLGVMVLEKNPLRYLEKFL